MKRYRTPNGSMVTIYPTGGWRIEFDWFEEDACESCNESLDVETSYPPALSWNCEDCGRSESIELEEIKSEK